ncbi:hypothetical protein HMPREF1580_01093 [Gardnerella vaginalis JCP8070]|nr:hypothetical protein HMPREF1580_01093 [Gardnerella vaginalis JCP8070]
MYCAMRLARALKTPTQDSLTTHQTSHYTNAKVGPVVRAV